jgi:hypothetical protein
MTNQTTPSPFFDLAGNVSGLGFTPVLVEQMTSGMMRLIEAQFALAQTIAQAQFGLLDAMVRAANRTDTDRPASPPKPATHHIDLRQPERVRS